LDPAGASDPWDEGSEGIDPAGSRDPWCGGTEVMDSAGAAIGGGTRCWYCCVDCTTCGGGTGVW
jgi:hypothetical protein